MTVGRRSGADGRERPSWHPSVEPFLDDEGGYTTVAVAVALLASLALVFSIASVSWTNGRAGDVQAVADSAALAGSNAIAGYTTVAQVLDACVLSLGLLGVTILGVGLVLAAIPVAQAASPQVVNAGREVLTARRKFAKSAAQGLQKYEKALPTLVAANASSCVSANAEGQMDYVGTAFVMPVDSATEFGKLDDQLDDEELAREAEELRQASARKEEADRRAQAAKERAWQADTRDKPLCMRSRAQSLAGLSGVQNPDYPSADLWRFGYARIRAQNYYYTRWQKERVGGANPDELQRSCARKAFFHYAWQQVSRATCVEGATVQIDLPDLPHTTAMVKGTSLYRDTSWPCTTAEDGSRTLHCSLDCPAAQGQSPSGNASLADINRGSVRRCDTCKMDAAAMGNVADASTNINNGFEHYWRIVVQAGDDYERAVRDGNAAEEEMRKQAQEGQSAFQKAMDILSVDRPKIAPPGRYGVVAVVSRSSVDVSPDLMGSFLAGGTLPAGAAISASTLAPEENTDGHNILSSVFDGLRGQDEPLVVTAVGSITQLWGKLLVGYGSSYGSVSQTVEDVLEGIGNVLGEETASWLRDKIVSTVKAAGFEPADMRLRKPVLVNTQEVLNKAGYSNVGKAREFIESLPPDQEGQVKACKDKLKEPLGPVEFTVAEILIPGTNITIPLKIKLSDLWGGGGS